MSVMAEGVFPTLGIIPKLGKLFPMLGNGFRCRRTVSDVGADIGKQFLISGNGFRCLGTVSDVGEWFPILENSF